MNICKCGCGLDSIYCTVFGPETLNAHLDTNAEEEKNSEENEMVENNNMETVEEVVVEPTENYDLTNVPENVTINYEAGKRWLDKTFVRYTVRVNHNEDDIPYEIVLSAADYNVGERGKWLIGKGDSFSKALKELLLLNI
jgi:hypothetical protein